MMTAVAHSVGFPVGLMCNNHFHDSYGKFTNKRKDLNVTVSFTDTHVFLPKINF